MSKLAPDQAFRAGIKHSIAWLHQRATEMNDPKAVQILNSAAFSLGNHLTRIATTYKAEKPGSAEANPGS